MPKNELELDPLKDVLAAVSIFNHEYKEFLSFVRTAIISCNLGYEEFFQLCVVTFNRNDLVSVNYPPLKGQEIHLKY